MRRGWDLDVGIGAVFTLHRARGAQHPTIGPGRGRATARTRGAGESGKISGFHTTGATRPVFEDELMDDHFGLLWIPVGFAAIVAMVMVLFLFN